ncbi:mitogen-activated protein kinase-activated protein kinase 5 [Apostichopus japonicus]|uniref:non-specific serine/threonine protein kinase n=1 Tax=Stichopus japonicus TaxID=307972 RepID=A0A2G8KE01_STIJA|nr:mitogen-activated protein kinase-activated protein kinase 5 [Apostichopus japonicus]
MSRSHVKIKESSILDDYDVEWSEKLGTGVNGPVYRCRGRADGLDYALKLLRNNAHGLREVELHSLCTSHPHIVNIQDVYANRVQHPGDGNVGKALFVVMELMKGGELFDRITKAQKFTERNAARFTKQIALAVKRCHTLNIAHRDLKPENLLLNDETEDAVIKLGDFGFAKVDDGNLKTPHFTPYYVAPQVLEAKRKSQSKDFGVRQSDPYTYDKCCDMWSLGVIIYIMLCGYPPFCPTTPTDVPLTQDMQQKIMSGQYEFSKADWSHISSNAKNVVDRLLKVDPLKRMTVTELINHPWLQESMGTDIILNSPSIFMDKNMLLEAQGVHSAQLTSMRLQESKVHLKPMTMANNPLIRKRKQSSSTLQQPAAKRTSTESSLQKLKDLLSYCKHSLNDGNILNQDKLLMLIQDVTEKNSSSTHLQELLQNLKLNGETSHQDLDLNHFCKIVETAILALEMDKT